MPTPSARSRTPIVALLAALTLAAWAWTIHLGRAMPGMEMPAMDMTGMDMPGMDMPGMDMSGAATATATDWSDFSPDLQARATRLTVRGGAVTPA